MKSTVERPNPAGVVVPWSRAGLGRTRLETAGRNHSLTFEQASGKAEPECAGQTVQLNLSYVVGVSCLTLYSCSTEAERREKKSSNKTGILSFAGQSSLGTTRNALARQSNSKSETQRSCVSILARVSRLRSQPHRRHRAASMGWVKPCWLRNLRICGPTMFLGLPMFRNRNLSVGKATRDKVRNSERIALAPPGCLCQKKSAGRGNGSTEVRRQCRGMKPTVEQAQAIGPCLALTARRPLAPWLETAAKDFWRFLERFPHGSRMYQ